MPFDNQLDQEGVELQKERRCFTCNSMMKLISPGSYQCPSCRIIFNEDSDE